MSKRLSQRLSDGTTITLRQSRTLIGTQFTEVHSVRGVSKWSLLWMDGRMYAIRNRDMMPISNPNYSHAATVAKAALKALAFYVDSAESVIEHAKREGIPVADCY